MATPTVGERISYDGALCTVRYVGEVAGTSGIWLGVEWDDPGRGKHDGVHKGVRYFACRARLPPGGAEETEALTPASFVRPTRPADRTRTFLEAVKDKYAAEEPAVSTTTVISGKVAEEVGFEKVRRQMAQIETLRVVILDGMCLVRAADDEGGGASSPAAIRTTCPSITELDLSRNLFTEFRTVADICGQLPNLRSLRVNGNRLKVGQEGLSGVFDSVKALGLDETLLSWEEIGLVAVNFPALANLSASSNQLSSLCPLPSAATLSSTLTTLTLEFNEFTALSDLSSLTGLKALKNLHLKGNAIAEIVSASDMEPPVFSNLHYVDISYNRVASWAFVDALPDVFPGLTNLRFAHNPIYDNPSLDADVAASTTKTSSATNATASTEEAYMITVGRLAALRTLNFGTITPTDRSNAEMFYLSRIAKQMAAVAEGPPEQAVVARHRRFAELCELYGKPTVVRHAEINPAFLEARLITVLFCLATTAADTAGGTATSSLQSPAQKSVQIPESFDMYAVRGIAGKLFRASPQNLRLVWETGEWDPVAGFEDIDIDDEDAEGKEMADEEAERAAENADEMPKTEDEQASNDDMGDNGYYQRPGNHRGRWVRREVELKDTPRQIRYCVDGMEARIRVEVKA